MASVLRAIRFLASSTNQEFWSCYEAVVALLHIEAKIRRQTLPSPFEIKVTKDGPGRYSVTVIPPPIPYLHTIDPPAITTSLELYVPLYQTYQSPIEHLGDCTLFDKLTTELSWEGYGWWVASLLPAFFICLWLIGKAFRTAGRVVELNSCIRKHKTSPCWDEIDKLIGWNTATLHHHAIDLQCKLEDATTRLNTAKADLQTADEHAVNAKKHIDRLKKDVSESIEQGRRLREHLEDVHQRKRNDARHEATEMEAEVKQKNKELVRLGRQLHESRAAKESAQARSETKDRTIDRLQRDLSSAQHNVERLHETVRFQGATSRQRYDNWQDVDKKAKAQTQTIADRDARIELLMQENNTVQDRLNKTNETVAEQEQTMAHQQAQLVLSAQKKHAVDSQLTTLIADHMSQIAALTQEKADFTTSLSRTQSIFESVKQDLAYHQKANDLTCLEYGEKYSMLEHKLAQENKQMGVIPGCRSAIEQRLNEARAEVEKQQTESQAAETRFAQEESELNDRIAALETKTAKKQEDIENAAIRETDSHARVSELQRALQSAQDRLRDLRPVKDQAAKLQKRLEELELEVSAQRAIIGSDQNVLEIEKDGRSRAVAEAKHLENLLANKEVSHVASCEKYERESNRASGRISTLNAKLTEAGVTIRQLRRPTLTFSDMTTQDTEPIVCRTTSPRLKVVSASLPPHLEISGSSGTITTNSPTTSSYSSISSATTSSSPVGQPTTHGEVHLRLPSRGYSAPATAESHVRSSAGADDIPNGSVHEVGLQVSGDPSAPAHVDPGHTSIPDALFDTADEDSAESSGNPIVSSSSNFGIVGSGVAPVGTAAPPGNPQRRSKKVHRGGRAGIKNKYKPTWQTGGGTGSITQEDEEKEEASDAENSGDEADPRADGQDNSDDDDNDESPSGGAGAVSGSPSSADNVGTKDNQSNQRSSNETRDDSSGQGPQSASEALTSNHNNLSGTLVAMDQRNVRHKKKGTDDAMIDALCEPFAKAFDPATQITIQDHAARVDGGTETEYVNGDSANPGIADTEGAENAGLPMHGVFAILASTSAASTAKKRRGDLPQEVEPDEVAHRTAKGLPTNTGNSTTAPNPNTLSLSPCPARIRSADPTTNTEISFYATSNGITTPWTPSVAGLCGVTDTKCGCRLVQ